MGRGTIRQNLILRKILLGNNLKYELLHDKLHVMYVHFQQFLSMISLICYKINAWTTSNHMAVFVFVHDPKKASINAFWTFIKSFFVRFNQLQMQRRHRNVEQTLGQPRLQNGQRQSEGIYLLKKHLSFEKSAEQQVLLVAHTIILLISCLPYKPVNLVCIPLHLLSTRK